MCIVHSQTGSDYSWDHVSVIDDDEHDEGRIWGTVT